jgi:hypothetical protein
MAITVGVATLAASIVPFSLTDENASLATAKRACQALPWFMIMGFTIVFSALFCKLWRINKIFNGARQFRKLRVTEKDVMGPFLFWCVVNSLVLALRTGLDFVKFERVEIDDDPANTIASCQVDEGALSTFLFTANVIVTLSCIFAAAYQAYVARNVSEEYSESRPLMVALIIWLEILAICIPVLYILQADSITTSYFVTVSFIFGLCMSMLGALFIPLWRQVRIHCRANNGRSSNSVSDAQTATSRVHVTGLGQGVVATTGRNRTNDDQVVDNLHPSEVLGASDKVHVSQSSYTDPSLLLQKVTDLEAQLASAKTNIERLQERNQELESLCRKEKMNGEDSCIGNA